MSGIKYDNDKPPMDLLPHSVLVEVAKVLDHGAKTYSRHNWRQGFKWSRLHAAALRHIGAWSEGQDNDLESGQSHLAHAICCLMFLLEHKLKGYGEDDRYTTEEKKGEAKKEYRIGPDSPVHIEKLSKEYEDYLRNKNSGVPITEWKTPQGIGVWNIADYNTAMKAGIDGIDKWVRKDAENNARTRYNLQGWYWAPDESPKHPLQGEEFDKNDDV